MKFIKSNLNTLIILLISIAFLSYNIVNKIFNQYSIILLLLFILIMSLLLIGMKRSNFRGSFDIMLTIIICWFLYYIITYVIGYFIGFTKTPYLLDFVSIIKNITPVIIIIFLLEINRFILIEKNKKDFISFILISLTLSLFDISLRTSAFQLNQSLELFKYICTLVVPCVFKNFLLTYLSAQGGWKVTVIYRLFEELPSYVVPIFPDFGYYLESMIKIIYPVIVYFGIKKMFEFRQIDDYRKKNYDGIFYATSISMIVMMILLSTGLFNYYAVTIASNSMYPKIHIGDVVIIEKNINISKAKKGDIIAFSENSVTITHRVAEIKDCNGKICFKTKGDNNNTDDILLVSENNFIGIVRFKIPFIGMPSVWIRGRKK